MRELIQAFYCEGGVNVNSIETVEKLELELNNRQSLYKTCKVTDNLYSVINMEHESSAKLYQYYLKFMGKSEGITNGKI